MTEGDNCNDLEINVHGDSLENVLRGLVSILFSHPEVLVSTGLDTNFLHHFPLWKVDFKFYFPSQNFTIQNGLQFHIC